MTPKEKAKELIEKFRLNVLDYENNGLNTFKAKQCALIAVDEIIDALDKSLIDADIEFWKEVKKELSKI